MSQYRILISHVDGGKVQLKPGSHGEKDLIEAITERMSEEMGDVLVGLVVEKLGWIKTEAQVEQAIRESLSDSVMKKALEAALNKVLWQLKSEVIPQ